MGSARRALFQGTFDPDHVTLAASRMSLHVTMAAAQSRKDRTATILSSIPLGKLSKGRGSMGSMEAVKVALWSLASALPALYGSLACPHQLDAPGAEMHK